ncbi:MAG: cell division protein FtsA, partial [Candidatus Caldatribacteriaceae bacterium]
IHILPQEYLLDDETSVIDPVGMVASKLKVRVHLVVAQENQFQNVVKVFRQAGLEMTQAIFQPLASSLAVLTPMEREMGVALIDIGGGTTDLTLFYGGSVRYSKIIPVGGEHLTSDLAIGMRTYRDEAERVKVSYGCAFSSHIQDDELIEVRDLGSSSLKTIERKYVCKIVEARVREIFLLLGREIKASGLFPFLRGGMVITGGSALLESIADFASSFLKLPARIGYPDSKNYVGMVQSISNPIFSTACGLLQFAFGDKAERKDMTSLFLGLEEKGSKIIGWLKDFFMIG